MKKYIFFSFIFILLMLNSIVSANAVNKIQLNDNWTYIDNNGQSYNETVITSPYFTVGSDIAVVNVNTSRPFPFSYFNNTYSGTTQLQNLAYNLTTNFVFGSGNLVVTQVGAIPVATTRNFTATFNYSTSNGSFVYTFVPSTIIIGIPSSLNQNNTCSWQQMAENPEQAFETSAPTNYAVDLSFRTFNHFHFQLEMNYILSSTGTDNSNYTAQFKTISLLFETPNDSIFNIFYSTSITNVMAKLSKSQAIPQAYSFVLPNSSLVPTIITQTQPVPTSLPVLLNNIVPKLSANDFSQVTYTLQTPHTTSKTTKNLNSFPVLIAISSLMAISIYINHKRKNPI